MYNICIRIVAEKSIAEEILQDAFVIAFKNLNTLRTNVSFGSWLKKIVINRSLDYLRKKKIQLVGINELTERRIEVNDEIHIDPEVIHQSIKKLPDGARVVFNLYALENYKHKEIAELLAISVSTSKSQYQRARFLLKQDLNIKIYE